MQVLCHYVTIDTILSDDSNCAILNPAKGEGDRCRFGFGSTEGVAGTSTFISNGPGKEIESWATLTSQLNNVSMHTWGVHIRVECC